MIRLPNGPACKWCNAVGRSVRRGLICSDSKGIPFRPADQIAICPVCDYTEDFVWGPPAVDQNRVRDQ